MTSSVRRSIGMVHSMPDLTPERLPPVPHSRIMTMDDFWEIMDAARASTTGQAGDYCEAIAAALVERLATTSTDTILDFDESFHRISGALHRWDVWAAAHLIGRGCSDDMFSDFRAGILTLGRDWYTRVVANPDDLVDHPMVQHAAIDPDDYRLFAEPVGFAASSAFERVTGDHDAFWDQLAARSQGSPERPEVDLGEAFDFDDDTQMRRRLPRLTALFRGEHAN